MAHLLNKEIHVLDKGFIKFIDFMGCDDDIVKAARISTGSSTKTPLQDERLINYLMKHEHTSPFEMCEIKLLIKAPIFIARQWMRHRTASINEFSARYSELPDEYYFPVELRGQSKINHQCSSGIISTENKMKEVTEIVFSEYNRMLEEGVSREMARIITPVSTYTTFFWKIDLHNLLKFLRLRMDEGAQEEIRQYAIKIWEIVQEWVPITAKAFTKHHLKSVKFSEEEMVLLKNFLRKNEDFLNYIDSPNRKEDFLKKLI
jgi:thymidylate synthase (FAD)